MNKTEIIKQRYKEALLVQESKSVFKLKTKVLVKNSKSVIGE